MMGELLAADSRLLILQMMDENPGYSTNEAVLQLALGRYGHTLSRDRVRTELRWLEEQGLVTIETAGSLLIARLTPRGVDTASGAARIDGVKRPGPKG